MKAVEFLFFIDGVFFKMPRFVLTLPRSHFKISGSNQLNSAADTKNSLAALMFLVDASSVPHPLACDPKLSLSHL